MADDLLTMLLQALAPQPPDAQAETGQPVPDQTQAMPAGIGQTPPAAPAGPSLLEKLRQSFEGNPLYNISAGLFQKPDQPPADLTAGSALPQATAPADLKGGIGSDRVAAPIGSSTPPIPTGPGVAIGSGPAPATGSLLEQAQKAFAPPGATPPAAPPAAVGAPSPAAAPPAVARPAIQPPTPVTQSKPNTLGDIIRQIAIGAAHVNPSSPKTSAFMQGMAGSALAGQQEGQQSREEANKLQNTAFDQQLKSAANARADTSASALDQLRTARANAAVNPATGKTSVFEQKRQAYLKVHPGDEGGAIQFASGRKQMSDAEISKSALAAAQRDAKDQGLSAPQIKQRAAEYEKALKGGGFSQPQQQPAPQQQGEQPQQQPDPEQLKQGGSFNGWQIKPEYRDKDPSEWGSKDAWEKQ